MRGRPLSKLPGLATAKTEPWVVHLGTLDVAIQEVPFGASGAWLRFAACRHALTRRAAQRATPRSVARATAPAGRRRWLWADREGNDIAPLRPLPR